ncbi:DUF957 domain-containing protein [Salmonella enterica]|nr:DUF957 domain-containing protein [Salmonella enterica]
MNINTTVEHLEVLSTWLEDNINCDAELFFDNDETCTDSVAMYPAVERAVDVLRKVDSLSSENIQANLTSLQNAIENNGHISPEDVMAVIFATKQLFSA